MAVSMETQRLISVSLGKIAQSRGQRGGINLHKNLLVATVLHKARTAYMMESYSYQQHLQRQKLLEQYQKQNHQSQVQNTHQTPVGESNKGEVCSMSCDSNLGQTATTPANHEQSGSVVSSESATVLAVRESMPVQDSEKVVNDKENSPPLADDSHNSPVNIQVSSLKSQQISSHDSHLVAASQLSEEASSEHIPCKQQTLTSAGTTCNVLKRRRVNPSASIQDIDCPVNKIARVNPGSPVSYTDYSNVSSSGTEISHGQDSHQISSLVSIFNSGFSGLCSELHTSSYQSDFDMSSLHAQSRKVPTKAG